MDIGVSCIMASYVVIGYVGGIVDIYEIVQPGDSLNLANQQSAWELESVLRSLKDEFYEANLALNLFLNSCGIDVAYSYDDFEVRVERQSEIRKEIEAKRGVGNSFDFELSREIDFETDIIYKREKWHEGHVPKEFQRKLVFTYAKNFLYALDAFGKFLKVLSENTHAPSDIAVIYKEFTRAFPDVTGIRNTTQHMEDRVRGLKGMGENKKPISLQPLDNGLINSPTGALVFNSLLGTKYMSIMADGNCGEVDVSPHSMTKLQDIFQRTLDAFSWTGSKRHFPA